MWRMPSIAISAHRQSVHRITHRWAGLRSFVADHGPVVGPDDTAPTSFGWQAKVVSGS